MDILLVRHGEAAAEWGQHPDPGLSERGREQANAAARALLSRVDNPRGDSRWQLLTSPRARARETAAPLAAALGLEPIIVEAYQEIPAPVPLAERKAWLRRFMRQCWPEQPPSLWDWRREILDSLRRLEQPAVIFTHFLVINTVVGAVRKREETLCFWPDNGSITHLQLRSGELYLQSLGRAMRTEVN